MEQETCLFCKIADGRIPATFVYQDKDVVAFNDLNPQAPYHILFIPRRHIVDMAHLTLKDGEILGKIYVAAAQVARDLGLEKSGYRFISNVGKDAGQSVFHLHFHLLGGRPLDWPPG